MAVTAAEAMLGTANKPASVAAMVIVDRFIRNSNSF
jgi:hypothetical protein